MKKVLATILTLVMALALCSVSWAADCTNDDSCTVHMVKIGTTHYDTLAAAVASVHTKTGEERTAGTTIVLLHNATGSGFAVGYNAIKGTTTDGTNPVNITIDLNGCTYTMCSPTVGSAGTETNGFQFLKGSDITIKNGSIVLPAGVRCAYLFQNYANLTLQDVNIDIEQCEPCEAAVHSMNGVVNIIGSTSIAASGNYTWSADDSGVRKPIALLDWAEKYPDGTQITVESTGTFTGTIHLSKASATVTNKSTLTIKSGNFSGDVARTEAEVAEFDITGGTYTTDVSEYVTTQPVAQNETTDKFIVGATAINEVAKAGNNVRIIKGTIELTDVPAGVTVYPGNGTVKVNGKDISGTEYSDSGYTVPSAPKYYYKNPTTTSDDTTKGSPKTFDAGIALYAGMALTSLTGMAYVGKKKF